MYTAGKSNDWFRSDDDDVFGAGEEGEEEEVVEVVNAFDSSEGESENSDTDKLRELLREDSQDRDRLRERKSAETSLPNVDLDVYGSKASVSSTGAKGKGRARLGRRAQQTTQAKEDDDEAERSKAQAQTQPKTKLEHLQTGSGGLPSRKREGRRRRAADSGSASDGDETKDNSLPPTTSSSSTFNNALYVSPTKDSASPVSLRSAESSPGGGAHKSLQPIKSASSVTGEWSLDMDQMLPDSSKVGGGKAQGLSQPQPGATADESEATSSIKKSEHAESPKRKGQQQQQSFERAKKQEKLPSLKSPKMTMTTGYQPSFMTRTIEVEDSRSANDVSESIGLEYSEDFESSRSSLSPTRFSEAADEGLSRPTKSTPKSFQRSGLEKKKAATATTTAIAAPTSKESKDAFPSLSPKAKPFRPRIKKAASGSEKPDTSSPTPKKAKKKIDLGTGSDGGASKAPVPAKSADKKEVSGLKSKLLSLEREIDELKSKNGELLREKDVATNSMQAKIQSKKIEKEIGELKASLKGFQEENTKLKSAYEDKCNAEREFAAHSRELEEKVVSLSEQLREKEDISKSIESFNGIENARKLLAVSERDFDDLDDFHPVINEFLEEIRTTLQDERLNLRREQDRLDKLMNSVNQDKQSANQKINVAQNKEKELAIMQKALNEEKARMKSEVESERNKIEAQMESERNRIEAQIESERSKMSREMQMERKAFTERLNADREKMQFEKATLERSVMQLKSEEELLQVKIKRLDGEFDRQSQKVKEQELVVKEMSARVEEDKERLRQSRQKVDDDMFRVSKDLAHMERLKEDMERQSRNVTEDKMLINSERQILAKISAEINEKQMLIAKEREELQHTKESAENAMEKLAAERVEIAYQLKVLTDERLKASLAAKEAREAEVQLKSSLVSRKHKAQQSRGTQGWSRGHKSNSRALSSSLRMQLLMAELERERQSITHDKKRNTMSLEMQEKFLYEAKAELLKYHNNIDTPVWTVSQPDPTESNVKQQKSESQLNKSASYTNFTDLTQITTSDDEGEES